MVARRCTGHQCSAEGLPRGSPSPCLKIGLAVLVQRSTLQEIVVSADTAFPQDRGARRTQRSEARPAPAACKSAELMAQV